jgi:tetraacyldisaccharide 4'-kinase
MGADQRLGGRLRGWVPRWWRGEAGATGAVLDRALWPAEQAYRAAIAFRGLAYDALLPVHEVSVPVISVGNIAVGGSGKTPFAAWMAGRLASRGLRPGVVLRGYGEDEILVHREINPKIPVFKAEKRVEAAREAAAAGCNVVVLDDGYQHRRLHRDLDIVLVAAESWSGNPKLLPRGPWREGTGGLERAGVVVVTRKTASRERAASVAEELAGHAPEAVRATARLVADHLMRLHPGEPALPLSELGGADVLAIASLADPRPFQEHLVESGAGVELASFPDHHDFTPAEVERLVARAAGRTMILTRKEAVKLRAMLPADQPALVLVQRVEIETGRTDLLRAVRTAVAR